jgi:hypothetical protein
MTALGKVLVFVNLVFSLLTVGLITVVFISRTNWKNGFDNLEKQLQVARADLATERDSKNAAQQQGSFNVKAVEKQLKAATDESTSLKAQLAEKSVKLTQTEQERDANKQLVEVGKEENKRLVAEQQNLQGQLQSRDKAIVDLKKDQIKFRDDAVKYELAFKSARERAEGLLAQLTDAMREVRVLRASGGGTGGGVAGGATAIPRTPPAEDVRGRVMSVDAAYNLATVSVGSDVGVVRGTSLQLYRLDAADPNKSLYLGELVITDARPKEAVGRIELAQKRYPIRPGDEVSSSLSRGSR